LMLRQLLVTGLLLATLAGCTKLEGTCSADSDCASEGGLCDTSAGVCYGKDTETDDCAPACSAYQVCVSTVCRARFTGVTFLNPDGGPDVLDGGMVEVRAQLVVDPASTSTQFPPTLTFNAARAGGGDVGSFGSVTQNGDTYTVPWTIPSAEAEFTLTAAYPEASASGSVNVRVDNVAPTLTLTVPDALPRASGSTTQAEEKDSDPLYAKAFRRDESVTVTVTANEPVSNVTLTVFGIASGGGVGPAQAPVEVTAGGTCSGSPAFCGTATVNLSGPEMKEFRGTMQLRAEGRDVAGNPGSGTGGVQVTRWKWAFDGGGAIKASPALGEKGVVYFGTAITAGKVFGIEPSGRVKWTADVEAVEGSPAVGTFNATSDTELVYVASNFAGLPVVGSGTRLRAINGKDGSVLNNTPCTLSVAAGTPPSVVSAAAITTTSISSTPVETALFAVAGNHGSAVGLRPTSVGASTIGCVNSDSGQNMPNATIGGGLVATSAGQFAYPTDSRRMEKYAFGNPTAVWTANPGGGAGQRVFGMALLGNSLLGSGGSDFDQGGVFQIAFDSTGTPTINALAGTENGRVNHIVASADNQAWFGREFASAPGNQLVRYSLAVPEVAQSVAGTGVLSAAPVLGSDGRLYTINRTGELAVWTASDLSNQWKLPSIGLNVDASPTLDCSRGVDGAPQGATRPGVLYVAAGNKLHAFVVDSPRLLKGPNTWPKFQHDVRNTGNPDTPVTNCP
jgi:hypothetical protein